MATNQMNVEAVLNTKNFDKGAREMKQQMQDFGKVSGNAMETLGNAFGVSTQKMQQLNSAFKGLATQLSNIGTEGGRSFNTMLSGIGKVATGIAGMGLAGAVVSFKALNDAAQNFSNTMDGLNMKLGHEAWTSTYTQAMYDASAGAGKNVLGFTNSVKELWTGFKGFTGALARTGSLSQAWAADSNALDAAERARELGDMQASVIKSQLADKVKIAENEAKIAEYTRIAADRSATAAERAQAEQEARSLISENYTIQSGHLNNLLSIQKELNGLSSNTIQDTEKQVNLEMESANLKRNMESQLRSLDRLHNSIATNAAKAVDSEKQAAIALKEQADAYRSMSGIASLGGIAGPGASAMNTGSILPRATKDNFQSILATSFAGLSVGVAIKPDPASIQEFSAELESLLSSSLAGVGETIGSFIGDLMTGGDAFANLKVAALSAFGDMASSVGQIAIQMGLATEGIQAALTLSPAGAIAAIAAGTALVALGAAVKSGLANAANGASGGYSSSIGVASGAASMYSNALETRDIEVKVTGTLHGNGSQLLAVINNEQERLNRTT